MSPACIVPFSVDFFIGPGKVKVMEIHCPPRGIEMMLLPFRAVGPPHATYPGDVYVSLVVNTFSECYGGAPRAIAVFYPRPGSTFINREVAALAGRLEDRSEGSVYPVGPGAWSLYLADDGFIRVHGQEEEPDIVLFADTPEDFSYFSGPRQLVVPERFAVSAAEMRVDLAKPPSSAPELALPSLTLSPGEQPDWREVQDALGTWVVLKDARHLPWWSGVKQRCSFLNLRNAKHRGLITHRLSLPDRGWRLESLFTESRDCQGHFGELRVFGIIKARYETWNGNGG